MPGPSRDWEIMDYYVKHHYILTSLIFQEIAEPGTWYVKEFWVLFRHMTIVFRTKLKKWKSHWCYTTVIDSAVKQDWGLVEAMAPEKPGKPKNARAVPGLRNHRFYLDYHVKLHSILTSLISPEIAEPGTWSVKDFLILDTWQLFSVPNSKSERVLGLRQNELISQPNKIGG